MGFLLRALHCIHEQNMTFNYRKDTTSVVNPSQFATSAFHFSILFVLYFQ